jgi:hypothetical protein
MQPLALTLLGLVAAGAGAFVALPLLSRPERGPRSDVRPGARPGLDLLERRDRALTALKELEFDHRTGKISDSDYHTLHAPLRREAAETLRLLGAAQRNGAAHRPRATRAAPANEKARR